MTSILDISNIQKHSEPKTPNRVVFSNFFAYEHIINVPYIQGETLKRPAETMK